MTERRDLPLFAWGDALRAARLRRRTLTRRGLCLAAGVALLCGTIVAPPLPRLVWNASASAPIGLYGVHPRAAIRRGDIVIAWAPPAARQLAAVRRYLPINVPLVKRVAAVPGDRVCAIGGTIIVNDRVRARRRTRDAAGRPMPWWHGCRTLRQDSLLLLMDAPGSFDGRYFGVTRTGEIIGTATPLWVG